MPLVIPPPRKLRPVCCEAPKGFYLGTTCPECGRPFRSVIKVIKPRKNE